MLYLLYYFLGIYLTIADYVFLPKKYNRFAVMTGIHLALTVPSAYFLAKELGNVERTTDNFLLISGVTVLLTLLSLLLSGLIVKRIEQRIASREQGM